MLCKHDDNLPVCSSAWHSPVLVELMNISQIFTLLLSLHDLMWRDRAFMVHSGAPCILRNVFCERPQRFNFFIIKHWSHIQHVYILAVQKKNMIWCLCLSKCSSANFQNTALNMPVSSRITENLELNFHELLTKYKMKPVLDVSSQKAS